MGSYQRFPKASAKSQEAMQRDREWREAQLRKAWDAVSSVRRFGQPAVREQIVDEAADPWIQVSSVAAPAQRTLH